MITKRRYIALAAAALLVVGAAAMPASAAPGKWNENALSAPSIFAPIVNDVPRWAQRKISASEAKSIARKRAGGGEAIEVSPNGNTYRVRVISKGGKVVDILVDATTGKAKVLKKKK